MEQRHNGRYKTLPDRVKLIRRFTINIHRHASVQVKNRQIALQPAHGRNTLNILSKTINVQLNTECVCVCVCSLLYY